MSIKTLDRRFSAPRTLLKNPLLLTGIKLWVDPFTDPTDSKPGAKQSQQIQTGEPGPVRLTHTRVAYVHTHFR